MTVAREPRTSACHAAIAALPFVMPGDGAGFFLGLDGRRRAPLRLTAGEGWAELTLELGEPSVPADPWDTLAVNAAVPGAARLVLRPGDRSPSLRADVLLATDRDPAPCLAAACEDLRCFAGALDQRARASNAATEERRASEPDAAGAADELAGFDIAPLLAESGWPFVQRAPNRIAVDLGLSDWHQRAFITPAAGRRHRVRATLAVIDSPTAATRRAIGVLLLTVSAVVRTVRGGRVDEGGESTLFFDARLGEAPDSSDVDAALGAVAMACQMAGRETRALADERIARAYLAARRWAA